MVRIQAQSSEDRHIEFSFSYKTRSQDNDFPKRYDVDTFIILPPQLNINSQTYPISSFYRDMKSFINFRIPKLSYKELVGVGKNRKNSPIVHIRSFLQERKSFHLDESARRYIRYELNVWCCALFYYLERKNNKSNRLVQQEQTNDFFGPTPSLRQAFKHLASIRKILQVWTELIAFINDFDKDNTLVREDSHRLQSYVIMLIRDHISETWSIARNHPQLKPMLREYAVMTRLLRWYSKRDHLPWIDHRSSTRDKENYVYEKAELKKTIWSSLYIDTRTQTSFKLRRQIGPMFAAGFAGLWAVIINIAVIRNQGTLGSVINLSTLIIVCILVIAYVLKDRIKEAGRSRFKSGLFGKLPDSNSVLFYESGLFKDPIAIGRYTEKAYYGRIRSLPSVIQQRLNLSARRRAEYLGYSKTLQISPRKLDRFNLKIRGLYDFFRLNLAPMMFFIEHSFENLRYVAENGQLRTELVPKVYKLDVVFRINGKPRQNRETTYQAFRITISKQQIVRVSELRKD